MKAVTHPGNGGLEEMRLVERPEPHATEDAVLVSVHYCGVNYSDIACLEPGYNCMGGDPSDPVPGGEIVGRRLDTGERVMAICGAGGYAERAAVPADLLFPIPDDVSDEAAAALLIQGLSAWHIVTSLGRLAEGESILIPSAAGGLGYLAVQIAKAVGASRIVATASSEAKRDLVLAAGASAAIAGGGADAAARAIEANLGQRFDLVLDRELGPEFTQSMAALGPRGRIVCYGTRAGPFSFPVGALLAQSQSISGFWLMDFMRDRSMADRAFADLFALHRAGQLDPKIGLVVPLAEAAAALRAIGARETVGKVLLDPRA